MVWSVCVAASVILAAADIEDYGVIGPGHCMAITQVPANVPSHPLAYYEWSTEMKQGEIQGVCQSACDEDPECTAIWINDFHISHDDVHHATCRIYAPGRTSAPLATAFGRPWQWSEGSHSAVSSVTEGTYYKDDFHAQLGVCLRKISGDDDDDDDHDDHDDAAAAECPASRTYAQCGGFTYNGETCCPDGWGCAYISPEYSQCSMCSEAYGQCGGGPGYNGSTCCTSGFKCTAHGDYYKGCDEDKVPPCTNNLFDTCGGKGWQGEKCCSEGSECRATGPYHSMCQSCATEAYAKCGGKGHKGPTCCTAGFKCISHGPYHSQCEPATIV